jgi:glyoxylate reductase
VDKQGVLCLVTDRIDAPVLDAATGLKVVSNVAVGYDNIDVAAATQRGILVTNTPGVVTESTADLTWSLLCSVARRIAEGDRYIRAGKWRDWTLLLMAGSDIYGRTLGICGMGRIGQAVARRAQGFHMRILYHNRQRLDSSIESEFNATWVEKHTLLQQADFVSLHVPLSPATTHFIGAAELRMMRPTAYLRRFPEKNLPFQKVDAGLITMSYLGNCGSRCNRASTASIATFPSAIPFVYTWRLSSTTG